MDGDAVSKSKEYITITINNKKIKTQPGVTIFQAAHEAGIPIPHLCYHPSMSVIGSCRLCVVEVEGKANLPAACSTPVSDGMVIWTETERVNRARKVILNLLLANHPLDCLTCQKTGDCRLQEYAYQYNVSHSKYNGEVRDVRVDDTNPFFERDLSKCILCGRCIYECAENVGVNVYDYAGRGFDVWIAAGLGRPLENSPCIFCGNCITVCPTGALLPKLSKGKGRSFEVDTVQTVCPYCGVGCAMNLEVNRGVVVGVKPANGPANRNLLCVKGRFGWDFIQNPDRLTTPLIKVEGRFIEAGWDEALNLVAARLLEIKDRYGPDAVAGISSAKCTNEENYLFQKFMRAVIGTNNVDNSARLCHSSTITGLAEAFGSGAATNSIAELEEADVIFIIGSNTMESHPVIGMRVQKAHRRQAKIILADPRKIDMAEMTDIHLQHFPGTDVALLNGIMHVILERNLHDLGFINERTKNFEELKGIVKKYNPSYVSALTGVPAEKIIEAAELYARSNRSTILYAMGITQHVYGTDNVRSAANLAMLTGNVGRPSTGIYPLRGQNNVQGACDMGALPNYLPGYQRVVNEDVRKKFEEKWGCKLPPNIGYTVVEMTEAALDGRLKGMYIMGENPVLSNPDIYRVEQGLKNLDFLVVQDIFLTETAMFADVVLPGTSFAEKDGTFSNTERRIQRVRKAIEPLGYSLPDWRIICLLSGKCGFPFLYKSPEEIMDEIAGLTPIYGGISYSALGEEGIQWPCPYPGHPGTSFLHHKRFAGGMGYFAGIDFKPPVELPGVDYPFLLITGRNMYHFHTGTMTRRSVGLQAFRPDPYIEINPESARRLGIKQGELVSIESKRGSISVKAFLTDRVAPNQVFIPFHYAEGAANVLTHVSLDKEAKIPELKISAVKINKMAEEKIGLPKDSFLGDQTHVSAAQNLPETAWVEKVDNFIKKHGTKKGSLIPILQEVQRAFGFIAADIMAYLARRLKRPMSEVYGVASFYAQFYLKARGKYMIRVCTGTACHVRGSDEILAAFSNKLGIDPGETTPDKLFSLERVACVGACGLAPVVMVNEKTFGRMEPTRVDEVINFILKKEQKKEQTKEPYLTAENNTEKPDSPWLYKYIRSGEHEPPENWKNI